MGGTLSDSSRGRWFCFGAAGGAGCAVQTADVDRSVKSVRLSGVSEPRPVIGAVQRVRCRCPHSGDSSISTWGKWQWGPRIQVGGIFPT